MCAHTLSIDIETFSSIDLIASGVYRYVEAPDFQILLFAYAFGAEQVQIVDLTESPLPEFLLNAIQSPDVLKTAFNANFERTCLTKFLGIYMAPEQWACTMVHALMAGFPGSLAHVAEVMKLEQQKMKEGSDLIKYFSIPCRPTKANKMRIRNLPEHALDKWEIFKTYCKQDVETERAIRNRLLSLYKISEFEQSLWALDQRINDRGIRIDRDMVSSAIACDEYNTNLLEKEAEELTGLQNTNSVAQLKQWMADEKGIECESLDKKNTAELINSCEDTTVCRLLKLRKEMGKSSIAKYKTMKACVCDDGAIRGILQFYSANRTGRWAGRLVQVHNLPQNHLEDLEYAREILKTNDFELLGFLFGSISDTLSQLIRTAFIPSPGSRFIIADFSAIEARIIAWLADEQWRMDIFNSHGKIYEASAAQMFKVPIESITKGNPLRQKGKIAELALGYAGGVGALITMGALQMGVPENELPELVTAWRDSNAQIVKLWKTVYDAAIKAVSEKTTVIIQHNVSFIYDSDILYIQLPSGRRLCYISPEIGPSIRNDWNQRALLYKGINQTTRKWETEETYGGKLTENIIQAIARDCLAATLARIAEAGYSIVMHVHDEVIIDAPIGFGSVDAMCKIMGAPIDWAPGLPLKAAGFESLYYKKD